MLNIIAMLYGIVTRSLFVFFFLLQHSKEKTRLGHGQQNLGTGSPNTKMWVERDWDLLWSLTILRLKASLDNE